MPIKKKILVTGSNGQLGKELNKIAAQLQQTFNTKFEFVFLLKEDLPIQQVELVKEYFHKHQPHYLINCAAYTAVDKAEQEQDQAYLVNAEAVAVLAAICKEYQTKFIHISTDYVFDGNATSPYKENSLTNPASVYGASKLEGEKLALQNNPDVIIIRTSWVYSEFGKNFVKTMLKLMNEKEAISVVNDQQGSPTYAADLATVIIQIILSEKWVPGIYHYCNKGIISWFDFAMVIKELSGSSCKITPITTSQYPTAAKRPAYSAFDTAKIQKTYNLEVIDWKESLAICLGNLK